MLVPLSVLKNILTINSISTQAWQKLNSLSIISVKVNVVNLPLKTWITNCEVNVVNVLAMLMLVFFLDHVILVKLSQGLVKVSEHFVELASDSQLFAVIFLNKQKSVPFLIKSLKVMSLGIVPLFLLTILVERVSFSEVIVLFSAAILSQLAGWKDFIQSATSRKFVKSLPIKLQCFSVHDKLAILLTL